MSYPPQDYEHICDSKLAQAFLTTLSAYTDSSQKDLSLVKRLELGYRGMITEDGQIDLTKHFEGQYLFSQAAIDHFGATSENPFIDFNDYIDFAARNMATQYIYRDMQEMPLKTQIELKPVIDTCLPTIYRVEKNVSQAR